MKPANATDKKAVLSGLLELFQNNRRWLLFFGTGTSCELDGDFGMEALKAHLRERFDSEPFWMPVNAALTSGKSWRVHLRLLAGFRQNRSQSFARSLAILSPMSMVNIATRC
jgi:hypothetical protein